MVSRKYNRSLKIISKWNFVLSAQRQTRSRLNDWNLWMWRNWDTGTHHGHFHWCQGNRKYVWSLINEKRKRRTWGKEGTREGEKVGREEGEAVEALGYRAADSIDLEEDNAHLPLVVDAPLLHKNFVKSHFWVAAVWGCYRQLFYINMGKPQKDANSGVNVKLEEFLT